MSIPSGHRSLVIQADWDDAAHLSTEEKRALFAALPPHQRDARSKGIPALGSGAIYPVPESDVACEDFSIPTHWPRGYAMDVGALKVAVLWAALDRESDVLYIYSVYVREEAEPPIHAEAIKSRGVWIPGRIDPAARGRGQTDGRRLFTIYRDLGLDLEVAPNAVESGIYEVWMRLTTGRLKVFGAACKPWFEEFRTYRRDDKGRIVKEHDHLLDGTRYFCLSGVDWLKTEPIKPLPGQEPLRRNVPGVEGMLSWMR